MFVNLTTSIKQNKQVENNEQTNTKTAKNESAMKRHIKTQFNVISMGLSQNKIQSCT